MIYLKIVYSIPPIRIFVPIAIMLEPSWRHMTAELEDIRSDEIENELLCPYARYYICRETRQFLLSNVPPTNNSFPAVKYSGSNIMLWDHFPAAETGGLESRNDVWTTELEMILREHRFKCLHDLRLGWRFTRNSHIQNNTGVTLRL